MIVLAMSLKKVKVADVNGLQLRFARLCDIMSGLGMMSLSRLEISRMSKSIPWITLQMALLAGVIADCKQQTQMN